VNIKEDKIGKIPFCLETGKIYKVVKAFTQHAPQVVWHFALTAGAVQNAASAEHPESLSAHEVEVGAAVVPHTPHATGHAVLTDCSLHWSVMSEQSALSLTAPSAHGSAVVVSMVVCGQFPHVAGQLSWTCLFRRRLPTQRPASDEQAALSFAFPQAGASTVVGAAVVITQVKQRTGHLALKLGPTSALRQRSAG
jgi:hypothetical protein